MACKCGGKQSPMDMDGKAVCQNCGQLIEGQAKLGSANVPALDGNRKTLNVHGHGWRSEENYFIASANIEVAYWVPDTGLFGDGYRSFDAASGTPDEPAVELCSNRMLDYSVGKMGENDAKNYPTLGDRFKANLIEAVTAAIQYGSAGWLVNTGKMAGSNQGVISLRYICSAINQVKEASDHKWRVNMVCCRESI